ncbi:MAG: hypothetical protein US74_C0041G0016, partial [Parcubacteria group bacterium GW2011_GWA2_38_13]
MKEFVKRKSLRLPEYDYSQAGYYFVTICTENKKCLFGKVENGKMILNQFGKIVDEEWKKTLEIRKNVLLDAFIIMPNHVHGIIIAGDQPVGVCRRQTPKRPVVRPVSIRTYLEGVGLPAPAPARLRRLSDAGFGYRPGDMPPASSAAQDTAAPAPRR